MGKGEEARKKAGLLSEALPLLRRYDGRVILIKYGRNAMEEPEIASAFARDVALLRQSGARPVVVHGGGPQIDRFLEERGVKSVFQNGLRVTGADEIAAVEMVLAGAVNKRIVREITRAGARAVGLSGMDGGLMEAEKLRGEAAVDLGFVGRPSRIDTEIVDLLLEAGYIPVIAPLAADGEGRPYNINADMAAGALAVALHAARFLVLTNVPAVRDGDGKVISELTPQKALALIKKGIISDGMKPKVEECLQAVAGGVEAAVILDGSIAHALLLELFTDLGAGTLIAPPPKKDGGAAS